MEEQGMVVAEPSVSLGTLRANEPAALVEGAAVIASQLANIIESRKLYNNIQGKKFVRVEGWTTLAALLGCLPREISNNAQEDGSYIATVELTRMDDERVISRATAECGVDETQWKDRPRYARRSMAATRATSKVCRVAFSWVMCLAGFEVTPAEEITGDSWGPSPAGPAASTPNGKALSYQDGIPIAWMGHPNMKGQPITELNDEDLEWLVETTGKGGSNKSSGYYESNRKQARELANWIMDNEDKVKPSNRVAQMSARIKAWD